MSSCSVCNGIGTLLDIVCPLCDGEGVFEASTHSDVPVNRLVPIDDEPWAMQWEFELTQDRINAPRFTLHVPVLNEMVDLEAEMWASVDGGNLKAYLRLPNGTRARWVQWAGPRAIRTRYVQDTWTEGGNAKRHHWRIDDHAEGGVLRVGVAVFFTEPSNELPKAGSRFRLLDKLGKGSFGAVHKVLDQDDDTAALVAKVITESCQWNDLLEAHVLYRLSGCIGFPKFKGLFTSGQNNMMVMQQLHRNLESLMKDTHLRTDGHLSAGTVVGVGIRCIDRLQTMHELGLLHRDIKPENIMIDMEGQNDIYLIDFGLSRPYRVAGVLIDLPKTACGTVRYYATRTYDGLHAPITDLETLCHVLCYVAIGRLPWQGRRESDKKVRDKKINELKQNFDLLCIHVRTCPHAPLAEALLEMVTYCRTLPLDALPDYEQLRKILLDARPVPGKNILERAHSNESTHTNYDWIACSGGLTPAAKAFKVDENPFGFDGRGTCMASKGVEVTAQNESTRKGD